MCCVASVSGYMFDLNTLISLRERIRGYVVSQSRHTLDDMDPGTYTALMSLCAIVVLPEGLDIPRREYLRSLYSKAGFAGIRFLTIPDALVLRRYETYIEQMRRYRIGVSQYLPAPISACFLAVYVGREYTSMKLF